MAVKHQCYCFVSEADSLAGPRIIQALTTEGVQSHLFFPPFRAPLDPLPKELCRQLSRSLGYADYLMVSNGQGRVDRNLPYASQNDETGNKCRAIGKKRISLWIEGYPRARQALSHPGNTYPRWGYGVMDFLLKEGFDGGIFRPENLGAFPYYLEWCIRTSPARYGKYAEYIRNPPEWYRELFEEPPPRPHWGKEPCWNPYHLPPPKPLDADTQAILEPLREV